MAFEEILPFHLSTLLTNAFKSEEMMTFIRASLSTTALLFLCTGIASHNHFLIKTRGCCSG